MDEQNKPKEVVTGQSDAVVNSQPAINGNVIPAADAQQTTPLATEQSAPASGVVAQPATNLPSGVSDYSAQIQQMYDAQLAAKQQSLESAYNQNLSTMQAARDKIAPTYINQGNDLATQYERTRRANNMQADMNGLNTGTASQMALAQQSNYLDAFGKVRAAQATAESDADRQIADLEVSYKSAVAQALADNDYQKATALLAEYQRRDDAAEEMRRYNQQQAAADAKIRAAYGDFSAYAQLYGQDVASSMEQYWIYSNPDYAYATGKMTAAQYRKLTGRYPAGVNSGSSSSSSSGGRSGGGGGGGNGGNGGSGNTAAAKQTVDQIMGATISNKKGTVDPSLNTAALGAFLDEASKNLSAADYGAVKSYAASKGAQYDDKYNAYLAAETASRRNAAAQAQTKDREI